ncbi:MAG: gliding motility-associated protein GldE [Bacteroidia bacterium]|nr:gliding motility-associated protein GldE [Bacteroidia bacterium]MBP7260229.1 gliding motility-associated protein GldE [Bacteroidia bacterium]MBP9179806.1 gliding motility-associated protein GldE [Bacteroidia bacterium]MBP9723805.1 gliding motility-associated protein GldE [Bacteroidia bacterium]
MIFASLLNTGIEGSDWLSVIISIVLIGLLLLCSALMSGSENAFFSLSTQTLDELRETDSSYARATVYLLNHPKKLLATILIANNFVNVAVVMISSFIVSIVFNFTLYPLAGFILQVVVITFLIVMIGEVLPKIYAVQNSMKLVKLMAVPMLSLSKVLYPFVYVLEKSTSIIDKRITKKGHMLSIDELTHAINITSEEDAPNDEKEILRSIVNFGNISVKEIMKPRMDVVAYENTITLSELIKEINEWGYSRIPVYEDNFDKVIGVLYIKDLLPHLNKDDSFKWQQLIKPPYFVPESKKIDDLLKEFQSKRVHLAVVVDEYGGTNGIVTMEDILEEIFGEIKDEFDDDELFYSKLDENNYVLEAKIPLNDMCKLMELDDNIFDSVRGESDTLGGMILEITRKIPNLKQKVEFGDFTFTIESVDKRKIKRVKVTINRPVQQA